MAKLYFYYSAMNAGKTTVLLQSSYNYRERGMHTLILTPAVDDRFGKGVVHSRIGIQADAVIFNCTQDLLLLVKKEHDQLPISCVMVDEAQFLTKEQVIQLTDVADDLNIPVLAYGLRTDFTGEPFVGSQYLLSWADKLTELKTICHCGKKASHVVRFDKHGRVIKSGQQVFIGGNESYVSLCRKHFKKKMGMTAAVKEG